MRARSFSFSLFHRAYCTWSTSIHPSIHGNSATGNDSDSGTSIVKCIVENDCGGKTASYIFREMKVRRNNDFGTTIKNVKCILCVYIYPYSWAPCLLCDCAIYVHGYEVCTRSYFASVCERLHGVRVFAECAIVFAHEYNVMRKIGDVVIRERKNHHQR